MGVDTSIQFQARDGTGETFRLLRETQGFNGFRFGVTYYFISALFVAQVSSDTCTSNLWRLWRAREVS